MTTLEGHKIIIALHNDHFKNAFFGSGIKFKEEEEGIMVIKETTWAAFEDFVGFFYEKNIKFEKKTLRELFEILNLAERYQVNELKEKVSGFIDNFPLSIDNVVEVAATTQEFSHFEIASQDLYANCSSFVQVKLNSLKSVLNFVQKNEDEVTVKKLIKELKYPCSRCHQRPCKISSYFSTGESIVPGRKVKNGAFVVAGEIFRLWTGRCRDCQNMGTRTRTVRTISQHDEDRDKDEDEYEDEDEDEDEDQGEDEDEDQGEDQGEDEGEGEGENEDI